MKRRFGYYTFHPLMNCLGLVVALKGTFGTFPPN